MEEASKLPEFGFSQYETACYLALVAEHPANGSRLSKISGIARSRIYDVLRSLARKGYVFEVEPGQYVPLPPDELKKKLRRRFDENMAILDAQLESFGQNSSYEYLLTLRGYSTVLTKAREIVAEAREELYLRLFPEFEKRLRTALFEAEKRGVQINCISMGETSPCFRHQIIHPEAGSLREKIGGESLDIIADRREALVGIFEDGQRDSSPIIWTRNRWFVITNRDSLRHDFYHYFLHKLHDRGTSLTAAEEELYRFIKAND